MLPYNVQKILFTLNESGKEAFLVGGAVRNMLMGRSISDYDITTNALPEEIISIFKDYKTIPTGFIHGTITVVMDGERYEVTTYRLDTIYKDHRHPSEVVFTHLLEQDCARRDFTINAICFHPTEGLIDFYHGQEDIEKRIIRTIGDPKDRFNEDALRILRALRFASQLDFTIHPDTSKAIHKLKDTLSYISKERIHDELIKTLVSKTPGRIINDYKDVFELFIPGISNIEYVDYASNNYLVRLALLLKDNPNYLDVLTNLKFSNEDKRVISQLIENSKLPTDTLYRQRKLLNKLEIPLDLFLEFINAYNYIPERDKQLKRIVEDNDCVKLAQLTVNGNDLKQLGIQDKEIGNTLNRVLDEIMKDNLRNNKQEIIRFLKE